MTVAILRGRWASLVAGALFVFSGCTLSPEERLRWDLSDEIYTTSARECAQRYFTIRVTRVAVNGDLQGDTAADSKSEIRPFTTCYWEGIQARVKARQEKGHPVPEPFNLKPEVDLD
jgi:hypothetical protein